MPVSVSFSERSLTCSPGIEINAKLALDIDISAESRSVTFCEEGLPFSELPSEASNSASFLKAESTDKLFSPLIATIRSESVAWLTLELGKPSFTSTSLFVFVPIITTASIMPLPRFSISEIFKRLSESL